MRVRLDKLKKMIRNEIKLREAYDSRDTAGEDSVVNYLRDMEKARTMEKPDWSVVSNEQLKIALSAAKTKAVGNPSMNKIYNEIKAEVAKRQEDIYRMNDPVSDIDDDEMDWYDDEEGYQIGDMSDIGPVNIGFSNVKNKGLERAIPDDEPEKGWWE